MDAKGMFLAAAGAGPVYRLLGKKDLGTTEFPAIETALIDGDVAFRQHSGGHTSAPNWPTFLMFAGRYLNDSSRATRTDKSPRVTEAAPGATAQTSNRHSRAIIALIARPRRPVMWLQDHTTRRQRPSPLGG